MQELVACIECAAKSLVDDPDAVSVRMVSEEADVILILTVAQADYGKVIGKNGRTVDALRTIVGVTAHRMNVRCRLEVFDEN